MQAKLKIVLAVANVITDGICISSSKVIGGNNQVRVSNRLKPVSLPRLSYAHMLLLASMERG
jgi:hypothetical protein